MAPLPPLCFDLSDKESECSLSTYYVPGTVFRTVHLSLLPENSCCPPRVKGEKQRPQELMQLAQGHRASGGAGTGSLSPSGLTFPVCTRGL